MTTIRNTNERFGEPVLYEGATLVDAVRVMQCDLWACGPEFELATVTPDDYEIIDEAECDE